MQNMAKLSACVSGLLSYSSFSTDLVENSEKVSACDWIFTKMIAKFQKPKNDGNVSLFFAASLSPFHLAGFNQCT